MKAWKGSTKNRIRLAGLVLLLCSLVYAAGCAGGGGESDADRITVTDCLGRQVAIPANPERIAAVDPFAGQAVIMFGGGDKILDASGGVQRDLLLQEMCPALKDAVTMSGGDPNIEELLRLEIDLLFIKDEAYSNKQLVEKLENAGIPFLVMAYDDMAAQMTAAKVVGEALGQPGEAELYQEYYQKAIDRAGAIATLVPQEKQQRLYHSVNEAVRTDPAGSLGMDWIAVTGAANVAAGANLESSGSAAYSTLEQIYIWNPDLIICNESGVADYILTDAKWSGLKAVREKSVYQIPIGVSRWGHPNSTETPLAILWLTKLLYPEEGAEINMEAEVSYFYQTFFDYAPTNEVIQRIYSGEGIRASGTGS